MLLTKRTKDLTNQKFGSLLVIEPSHKGNNNLLFWKCKCDCGNEHIARGNTLIYQTKKYNDIELPSCGCVELKRKTKHGFRKQNETHPLYRTYRGIMSRCYDQNIPEYKYYGNKGTTICDEWKNNPQKFIEWGLSNGWKKGLVIDKDILCDKLGITPKIYSPETCQFITRAENPAYSNNRDNYGKHKNIKISNEEVINIKNCYYNDKETLSNIARKYNVAYSTIRKIIYKSK